VGICEVPSTLEAFNVHYGVVCAIAERDVCVCVCAFYVFTRVLPRSTSVARDVSRVYELTRLTSFWRFKSLANSLRLGVLLL
jgi:hypothetical protein